MTIIVKVMTNQGPMPEDVDYVWEAKKEHSGTYERGDNERKIVWDMVRT